MTSIRDREVVTFYAKDGTKLEVPIERDPRLGPNEVEIHSGQGSWRFDTRTAHVVVTDSSSANEAEVAIRPESSKRLEVQGGLVYAWGYPLTVWLGVEDRQLDVTDCVEVDTQSWQLVVNNEKLLSAIDSYLSERPVPWSSRHPAKLEEGVVLYVRTEMTDAALMAAFHDLHHTLYTVAHGNLWAGHIVWPLYALVNEELAFRGLAERP